MRDGPEEEQNGKSAGKCRYRIDQHGYFFRAGCEEGKDASYDHKQGSTRRMAYLEFIGTGNKFPTIPLADRWFEGEKVYDQGN